MAAETGPVNNKIYYSLGCPRKGAGGGGGAGLLGGISRQVSMGGIPKMMEEGARAAARCQ